MKFTFLLMIAGTLLLSACFHPPVSVERYNRVEAPSGDRRSQLISELEENRSRTQGYIPGSVGVLTFSDNNPQAGLGLAATEFFTANLALFERFTLIDLSYSEALESEYATFSPLEKRNTLQAEQLVSGSVRLENGRIRIASDLLPKNARSAAPMGDFGGSIRDFFRLVADLNIRFLESNNITVTPDVANELYKSPTENLVAYILYAKGRQHERMGDYEEAARAYRAASTRDPKFKEARKSLQDVEVRASQVPAPQGGQVAAQTVEETPEFAPNILEELAVPAIQGNSPVIIEFLLPPTP